MISFINKWLRQFTVGAETEGTCFLTTVLLIRMVTQSLFKIDECASIPRRPRAIAAVPNGDPIWES
jgi:hypothetical protein